MRIQFLSDLHLDNFADWQDKCRLLVADADVLSIAGDVAPINHPQFEDFLTLFARNYTHVVYVPGNHDWWRDYGREYPKDHSYWKDLRARNLDKLAKIAEWMLNLHILNNSTVEIEGQRFVGSTMWFEPTAEVRMQAKSWADFRNIPESQWIWNEITACYNFLQAEVKTGDVVVTHHVPVGRGMDERFAGYPNNCFYIHPMGYLLQKQMPRIWHFGHTHAAKDFMLGETRFLCNPQGYPHETTGSRHHLVVEV